MTVAIPPREPTSTRTDEQHAALYRMFIIEGLSGAETAIQMNAMFPGLSETRFSVNAYSHRNGWPKGGRTGGHGRVPPPEAAPKRKPHPPGSRASILADLDPRDPDGKLIGPKQCHWPVGASPRGRMDLQLFCGEASHGDSGYCLTHYGIAYPTSRRAADAAQD